MFEAIMTWKIAEQDLPNMLANPWQDCHNLANRNGKQPHDNNKL